MYLTILKSQSGQKTNNSNPPPPIVQERVISGVSGTEPENAGENLTGIPNLDQGWIYVLLQTVAEGNMSMMAGNRVSGLGPEKKDLLFI